MAKLKLEIITPEKIFLQNEVTEVQIPTASGEIGILPGHIPLVSKLASTGILKYRDEGKETTAVVGDGIVEVRADKITILSNLAQMPKDINVDTTRQDLEAAEKQLKAAERDGNIDVPEALVKFERATIRLQAAQGK